MNIERVSYGTLDFNEGFREHKFEIRDYRFVTFNFFLQEYSGKCTSPVTIGAYIQFKNRYEMLYGNKIYTKHKTNLVLKKLFTFTNHDVTPACKITLTLKPEYTSAVVEYDILKEPR